MKNRKHVLFVSLLFLSLFSLNGCSQNTPASPPITSQNSPAVIRIATEGIEPASLQPGLAVTYFLGFFKRNLEYLGDMKDGEFETIQGEPVLQLNHQFGSGKVFNSGTNRGVAMRMTGYLFFPKEGDYEMQALSNDGVIISIGPHLILSDPRQHSDRLSDTAKVKIDNGGWAPIVVEYFQRKGTSALKLYWKVPGSDNFVPVPETSYGHPAK